MVRVKRGPIVKKKHKKTIELAKGYSDRTSSIRLAYQRVKKAMQYQYADRRRKKSDFSNIWINQINSTSRQYGFSYSRLVHNLKEQNILINNKILTLLSTHEPIIFKNIIKVASTH